MDTKTVLRQAENLASDEEKLVDITRRIYEQNPNQGTISDYVIALIKLADNYIRDERGWLAMPLLAKAEELLDDQPDTEENAKWKCRSYFDIGECYSMNTRRLMAKKAFQKALHHAIDEEDKENCEYSLDRLENPSLKYDPVEDSDAYLSVIDEVERRLYEELKGVPRHMGFCFRYWSAKRELLAEYGIEWRSPGIMNPRVIFD